jgi:hypothetical protein
MRKNMEHRLTARLAALLCALVMLTAALCALRETSDKDPEPDEDSVQASFQTGLQTGKDGRDATDTPDTDGDTGVQDEKPTIVGRWKVTNASQSGAALVYEFRDDGTVGFTIADFGALEEENYGGALMNCLRTGTYAYDPDSGELPMDTELCGFPASKTTAVVFSADGQELTFSDWNESCRRTAVTGLAVSESPSDLEGSWKNFSVPGGLDIITFGNDGTISYTCSNYGSLSRDKQLEICRALRSKKDYQYSFNDSNSISVFENYNYFCDIRFVIYGNYMALVTWDESAVTASTYRRAGSEDNTAPITDIPSAVFTVKMTSMNYANTDGEDASRHSFIQCQLPSVGSAPVGSDVERFNGDMAELMSQVTAMIAGGAEGQLYEVSTNIYEHPGVVDIVMATTAGGIYAENQTSWKVFHFDAVTGGSLSTSEYLALFGVTEDQAKAWAGAVPGYRPKDLTVYYDAEGHLYAVMAPSDGSSRRNL